MLYGLLLGLFVFISLLLAIIILLQQSKGGMGLGALGGSAQVIFGGSGGQDVFQKATWILGFLFMAGSLGLALLKTNYLMQRAGSYQEPIEQSAPVSPETSLPELPTE